MDRPPRGDPRASSSGHQLKARERSPDKDFDSLSFGQDTSACSPKRQKSCGTAANGDGATTSRAVSLLEESHEASRQEDTDEEQATPVPDCSTWPWTSSTPAETDEEEARPVHGCSTSHHHHSWSSAEEPEEELARLVFSHNDSRNEGSSDYRLRLTRNIRGVVGETFDYERRCTEYGGRPCWILDELLTWNKFLSLLSWQLRVKPGTTGQLCLVLLGEPMFWNHSWETMNGVVQLVCWLLQIHICLTHVEVGNNFFKSHHGLLLDALRRSSYVTSVKLICCDWNSDEEVVPATLPLPHLQELECSGDTKHGAALVERLPSLLATTTSLTKLKVTLVSTEGLSSDIFFKALGQNSSLKELELPSSIIIEAPPTVQAAVTKYLNTTTSLRSLTVAEDFGPDIPLKCILEGLIGNTSIVAVALTCCGIGLADVHLLSELFEKNKVLQSFEITSEAKLDVADEQCHYVEKACDRCLNALIENRTLEQITLPIALWDNCQWIRLFKASPTKEHLKRVTIKVPSSEPCPLLDRLSIALKGTDAGEKVCFDTPFIAKLFDESIMCQAFSSVKVLASDCNEETVCGLLERMPSYGSVTELHLKFDSGFGRDAELPSALTAFLRATRTLKTLILSTQRNGLLNRCQEALIQGLTGNRSLRELRVEMNTTRRDWSAFAIPLADIINASETITKVCFGAIKPCGGERAFIQRLSMRIEDNYTLLSVIVPEWADRKLNECYYKVWNVTTRNCSLLACAVDFARGVRRGRQCAEALELVHGNPDLVENLAKLENIDEARAEELVRNGLQMIAEMPAIVRLDEVQEE